ncbi:MAG: DUF5989 family protein [Planctomycetota bacterium]|jgi:hypothetical protein
MTSSKTDPQTESDEFARLAEQRSTGLVREFYDFLRHNKKWWMTPIIIMLLLLTVVVILASTSAAPFIYTLF